VNSASTPISRAWPSYDGEALKGALAAPHNSHKGREHDYRNEIQLVTRASRGIGQAITIGEWPGRDRDLVPRPRNGGQLSARISMRQASRHWHGAETSMTRRRSELLTAIRQNFGEISILVNNAGITRTICSRA